MHALLDNHVMQKEESLTLCVICCRRRMALGEMEERSNIFLLLCQALSLQRRTQTMCHPLLFKKKALNHLVQVTSLNLRLVWMIFLATLRTMTCHFV